MNQMNNPPNIFRYKIEYNIETKIKLNLDSVTNQITNNKDIKNFKITKLEE